MCKRNDIAIIGLGYVGLPLAVEFARKYRVLGFDISNSRIEELRSGKDRTKEIETDYLRNIIDRSTRTSGLRLSNEIDDLRAVSIYIITVPTPIDKYKKPDLNPLLKATRMIGSVLKMNDLVIYESTVYPGCTEEDCVPVLENESGLVFNKDFFCGYSPERVNPGDKVNTLTRIKKVTSGSTPVVAEVVDQLYRTIIKAGTYKAPNIKVAEASKAIENAQRDVNISFINELSLIFDRMGIDTNDVIDAAATKWNFLKFRPGLVGGHCIGVDPYYLAHKAELLGYYPQVILSGRQVNDNIGIFVANKVVKLMIQKGLMIRGAKAVILGVTFKENCPDIRNTRATDIYLELKQFGIEVDVYDPHANVSEVNLQCNFDLITSINGNYDAIILTVAHDEFKSLNYNNMKRSQHSVVFDVKGILDRSLVDGRL